MTRLAALLLLALPVAVKAQEAHKVPVRPAEIAYDDIVKCMGLYLALSIAYQRGSEEYESLVQRSTAWSRYYRDNYPTGFAERHQRDTETARDAIFALADNRPSAAEFTAMIEPRIARCRQLEDSVLAELP
jgi:hypothetical protein